MDSPGKPVTHWMNVDTESRHMQVLAVNRIVFSLCLFLSSFCLFFFGGGGGEEGRGDCANSRCPDEKKTRLLA